MDAIQVLIVDDDKVMAGSIKRALAMQRLAATTVHSGEDALSALRKGHFDAVLLDLFMPDMNGLDVLKAIRQEHGDLDVIAMSGMKTLRMAMNMLQLNAVDYLDKPFEVDTLVQVLNRLKIRRQSNDGIIELPVSRRVESPMPLVGKSPLLMKAIQTADRVANSDATVHIHGETGTGKEVIAHRIHFNSARANGPFVILNCSALPDTLLESELFGHEKGAFTDASSMKKGLLESAHGGTLFLDEIGEISASLQAKLLRVIETKRFRRLGSSQERSVDVRFLSATNKDLYKESEANRFRSDLYYRLTVITVHLPSLRERIDDLPLLINHFVEKLTPEKQSVKALPADVMKLLLNYSWPGNVRELRNVIEHLLIFSGQDPIQKEHLPERLAA